MERFRDCLSDCGLADLGFSGYEFTWNNRREGEANIQARLDRATCNESFSDLFPASTVQHLHTEEINHLALLIKVNSCFDTQPRYSWEFRFEEMWTRHEGFQAMIEQAWEEEDTGDRGVSALCDKLRRISGDMQSWSRNVVGSIRKEIKRL
jgi:hypothetical protein